VDELRRSEGRYRTLAETARDAIYVIGRDLTVRYCNTFGATWFHSTPDDLVGQSIEALFPPPVRDPMIANLRQVFQTGETVRAEDRIPFPTGELWLETHLSAVRDVDGAVAEVMGISRDITERKQAEEALDYRARFQELITSISSRFIACPAAEVDAAIEEALGAIGRFAEVDRSYAFQFSSDHTRFSCTHEWCRDGVAPAINHLQDMPLERFPWVTALHLRGEIAHVPRVADLPAEAAVLQSELEREGVRSMLGVPLVCGGTVLGFVGFDTAREERSWSEDEMALLRVVGEVFANALDRKRFEEKLRRSEERYRTVVSAQTDMINRYRPDFISTFVNEALCREMGMEAHELVGKSWLPVVPEEHRDSVRAMILSLNAKNPIGTLEHRVVRGNGEVRWQQWVNRAICDEQGRVVEYQGVGRDITELKRAEQALRESRERYRAITESAQDAIFCKDTSRRYTYCNPAMHALLGLSNGELIGKTPEEVFSAKAAAAIRKVDEATLDGEVVNAVRALPIHGERMTFHTIQVPLRDEEGRISGVTGVVRDVTGQRRIERALRASEVTYRTIFNAVNDGLYVHDAETGEVVEMNQTARRCLEAAGRDPDATTDLSLVAYEHGPFSREEALRRIRAAARGEPQSFEWGDTDGRGHRVVLRVDLTRAEIRGQARVLAVVRDITQQRRAEEQLRRTERLESLGLLAGGIAHDFNNMLMGIMASVSLAKLDPATDSDMAGILDDAEKAVMRAKGLTHQLLAFAKGGAPIRRAAAIGDLLRDTAEFALAGSNVRCQFNLPDDLWPANADVNQISQVVQNLVINAKQAMPDGGTLEIRARNLAAGPDDLPSLSEGRYVHVAVQDHGCGIDPDHLQRIFDPYFTSKGSGSGLGLAVCHTIVRNHGGLIRMDSTPGVGTTAEFVLPAVPDTETDTRAEDSTEHETRQGRILLMDDEGLIRRGARLMLRSARYEVVCAEHGEDAVELYRHAHANERPFDAVILDITVADGMGGLECLERLRAVDPDVCAIVSSGYCEDPVMAQPHAYGFRGVLPKPYSLEELLRVLDEAMDGGGEA
jgi:PAS domain S-box-containing protein